MTTQKPGAVCKGVDSAAITDEQLAAIGRYSRRPLTREEVFVFPVVLCDNEIDRDGERFPAAALEKLAELFPGRTGVFDHNPTARGQSARIFAAAVEEGGCANSLGETYRRLKAWAYMVRCGKNADLILEIDAGIKKEVSVGCAVARVLCSVCGADQRESPCAHRKGECYGGAPCHHLLTDPTDAYEWSFVAVPAQREAGVVKGRGEAPGREDAAIPVEKARLARLERLAALGESFEQDLRDRVVKLGLLAEPELPAATLRNIAQKLEADELRALHTTFRRRARERYPIAPQLAPPLSGQPESDREFRI